MFFLKSIHISSLVEVHSGSVTVCSVAIVVTEDSVRQEVMSVFTRPSAVPHVLNLNNDYILTKQPTTSDFPVMLSEVVGRIPQWKHCILLYDSSHCK